jgi:DNA-binding MarR family transcriptional regulator
MATELYTPRTTWIKHPYDSSKALDKMSAQDRIHHFIINYGPCCVSHIVYRLGVNRGTVTRAILKLEEDQLIRAEFRQGFLQNRKVNFYSGVK